MAKNQENKTSIVEKIFTKKKKDDERAARKALIEELFYDFNTSKREIYTMNFFRGIFFGLGSVLGGTIIVAFLIWSLGWFTSLPFVGDHIQQIQQSLESDKKN